MTISVSKTSGGESRLTRARLNSFHAVLGLVSLLSGIGCSAADSGPGSELEESAGVVENTVVVKGTPVNSPTTLDQKFLPGLGYLDGTTCDLWPRTLDFSVDGVRVLDDVLARYSKSAHVQTLRALSTYMTELGVSGATAVGSKYELVVTEASIESETALVALDEATHTGFMINDGWLCSESALRADPLACVERSVKVQGVTYSVLGRTTKGTTRVTNLNLPAPTVALVAPQIRFVPSVANGEIMVDTLLLAIGQRVYGGSKYRPGEDLSRRTNDYANVTVRPRLPELSANPSSVEWRTALLDARRPGLAALIGDEVGGIKQLTADAPALVEAIIVGYDQEAPAEYRAEMRVLDVRPEAYFQPQIIHKGGRLVPGENGNVRAEFEIRLNAVPRVRPAGAGAGAALAAGLATPSTTKLASMPGHYLGALRSGADIRRYVDSIIRPLLEPASGSMIYQVIVRNGSTQLGTVDGRAWQELPGYADQTLDELRDAFVSIIDTKFAPNDPTLANLTTADAGTDTGSRQAILGGQLFSRGVLADVMYGRAELESLRSGLVASTWTDVWYMMSDENLGSQRIRSFDPAADLNFDPAQRARAYELATYRRLEPHMRAKRNVLGLPYGQIASNWFTSASDEGQPSIYAAEQRWSELNSLVTAFQTAAEKSDELKNRAERDVLLAAVRNLSSGLTRSVSSSAAAAKTVSAASRANATTQAASLVEFEKGYTRLHELSQQLQSRMNTQWGCAAGTDPASCLATANAKMDELEEACDPDTGGFTWAQPIIDVFAEFMPALKAVNEGLKASIGKNLTETVDAVLKASAEGDGISVDPELVRLLAESAYELIVLEKEVQDVAQLSQAMRKIIDESSPECKVKGTPKTDLDRFRSDVILVDGMAQNYANQMALVKAQIDAQLGHLGYLATQGDAYDKLGESEDALLADLKAQTQPLLDKLTALSSGGKYRDIASQQRAFMTAACGTALSAARAAQADLHLISQALQTSTGAAVTKPHLVLPANAAYHFANGSPASLSQTDTNYGFAMSLWDSSAFQARFSEAGDQSTTSYLSQAGKRFAQLVNTEVCEDVAPKPAARFIVRKVFSGQALKTLVSNGQVDFKITLDDLVASANDGSNPVKGVVSQNLSTQAFDLKLDGAFMIKSLYSVCNGAAGKECGRRVIGNNLGSVAAGSLNNLNVVSRGVGHIPSALTALKVGRGGVSRWACKDGQQRVDATLNLLLAGTPVPVTSCLTPVLTPHMYASATYYDSAGLPDSQVLNDNREICSVDARTIAGHPLQGIPALGTWALANTSVLATALSASMTPAPISDAVLPVPRGVTAVEVLFLVGAEPVKPSDNGGYSLNP